MTCHYAFDLPPLRTSSVGHHLAISLACYVWRDTCIQVLYQFSKLDIFYFIPIELEKFLKNVFWMLIL